jgi:hypothetical protein
MRTFWKQLLLVVWLIGQTLGFGMTGICHESGYYAQASALCQQILPANCGYDALPDEAIHGYDCPAHPASAYDYPINHSAGSEKPSSEGIRPLFASTAGFLAAETTVAEQGRNALGQFTSKVGGEAAPGSSAVDNFIQNATQNGYSLVDKEVSFNTPFGMRRYDAVLTDSSGVNWGFEIKSSESAFSRWEGQQFSADRWINMNGGATAIGKQSGLQIGGSAKLLWPAP